MKKLGLGWQHPIAARRYRLMALFIVGMSNTAACHAGLRVHGEAGVAQNGGDPEVPDPSSAGGSSPIPGSSNAGGSVDGSTPSKTSPYQFCPCANDSAAQPVLTEPDLAARSNGGVYPSGAFTSVSVGGNYDTACGVRADKTLACWGAYLNPYDAPPGGAFRSVSVGSYFACGVGIDGTLACWGDSPPAPPSGTFLSVSVANGYATALRAACAIRTNATLACWAASPDDTLVPPAGTFTSISVGSSMACALKTDGTLACWHKSGSVAPPAGQFASVSMGSEGLCGVKADDTIACYVWRDQRLQKGCDNTGNECLWSRPPEGRFLFASAGVYSGCGIMVDGTLACWGMFKSFTLPGPFASVSTGGDGGVCALRTDGRLLCWLNPHPGAGGPPGGF